MNKEKQHRIYLVIGNKNVGKSSIIRSLTGIRVSGQTELRFRNDINETFYVQMTSLQEESRQTVQEAISKISGSGCSFHLIALRYSATDENYPNAEAYITAFINAGFTISGVAYLGGEAIPINFNNNLIQLSPPHTQAINKNASDIRNRWEMY